MMSGTFTLDDFLAQLDSAQDGLTGRADEVDAGVSKEMRNAANNVDEEN